VEYLIMLRNRKPSGKIDKTPEGFTARPTAAKEISRTVKYGLYYQAFMKK